MLEEATPYISPSTGKKSRRVLCRCSCGVEKIVHLAHLKNGTSQSCGCLQREISSTHGLSHTRAYKSHNNMMKRCYEPTEKDKECYEGVEVSPEWHDVVQFYNDMGECPEGYEIERLDCTKDYSKENCIWADEVTQATNRRKFKNNTSGKTGVVWSEGHTKWRVSLNVNKVKIEGGLFEHFEDAVNKREALEKEYLGYIKP